MPRLGGRLPLCRWAPRAARPEAALSGHRADGGRVSRACPPRRRLASLIGFAAIVSAAAFALAQVDTTVRPLQRIAPGTVVGQKPPEGWSHLIFKTPTRVAAESADKVNALTARLMSLLSTVLLADVQANRQVRPDAPYFLSGLAVGMATPIGSRDTIVSSDSHARLGANFGFIESTVLNSAETHLAKMRVTVRTRTMAVIDAEGVMLDQGKHVVVLVRYAVLVDPRSGRLETLAWGLRPADGAANHTMLSDTAHLLPPNLTATCELHVDPDHFILGVPTSMAFAMTSLPPARARLRFPESAWPLLSQARYTAESAVELERYLQASVAQVGAPE